MKIVLGETRREAINRIQERLGPNTSRPIAENTFWELALEKKIILSESGDYLIEDDITDDGMRDTAKKTINRSMKVGPRKAANLGPKSFKPKSKLRIHTMEKNPNANAKSAMKSMKSMLAPDPLVTALDGNKES